MPAFFLYLSGILRDGGDHIGLFCHMSVGSPGHVFRCKGRAHPRDRGIGFFEFHIQLLRHFFS